MKETKQRLEAFSDALYAIIMTIAVLEIPLPTQKDHYHTFFEALLTFAVSFFVVASYWNNHRHLFQHLEKISERIIFFNICYLFSLSLIPIFTKWAIHRGDDALPIVFYGGLLLLISFTFSRLFVASAEVSEVKEEYRQTFVTLYHRREFMTYLGIIFLMIIGFFFPTPASFLFMGLPIFNFITGSSFEKARHHLREEKMRLGREKGFLKDRQPPFRK